MYDFDLHHVSDIHIELAHHEVQIEQEVEVPALFYHRVAEEVIERHGVYVLLASQVFDFGELYRRSHVSYLLRNFGIRILLIFRIASLLPL